ncbi:hypothetical protein, partial [Aeromonas caviae]|uniref:hypothetical protein n=1 Tax=Aeromonas caviae TaxID=648 RepID=UPI001CC82C25
MKKRQRRILFPALPDLSTACVSCHLWEPELNHESDSGDETRQDLKIPTVSDGSLPRALSC